MEIDCSLNPNPELARTSSVLIHRTHGVPTTSLESTTGSRRLPPAPGGVELAGTSGGNCVARQRVLVGDSLDDEEWSNDLSNPPSRQTTYQEAGAVGEYEPEFRRG